MSLKAIRQRLGVDTHFFEREPAAPAPFAPISPVAETLERKERERQPHPPTNRGEFGAIGPEGADASPAKSEFGAKGAIGAAFSAFAPNVLESREFDLSAFAERAAIMEIEGGLPRAEAEQAAARELGFDTADALYRAAIKGWRSEIMATPPTGNRDLDKLAGVSLKFLGGGWALKALRAGWDEVSLFGIHEGDAPRERLDAWGVMCFLAWGTRGYMIEAFGRDFCVLRTSGGATLQQPRMRSNFDAAVPFWQRILLQHGPHLRLDTETAKLMRFRIETANYRQK